MTTRLLIIAAVCAVAVVVALIARRRPPDAPLQPSAFSAPVQLDRADFTRPDADWLVVTFTSSTCSTCAAVAGAAAALESPAVAVAEIEVGDEPEIHARYGIEAVPICVFADAGGVVRASFIGAVSATHMWAAVAEVREPGTVPPGCTGA